MFTLGSLTRMPAGALYRPYHNPGARRKRSPLATIFRRSAAGPQQILNFDKSGSPGAAPRQKICGMSRDGRGRKTSLHIYTLGYTGQQQELSIRILW